MNKLTELAERLSIRLACLFLGHVPAGGPNTRRIRRRRPVLDQSDRSWFQVDFLCARCGQWVADGDRAREVDQRLRGR